ncbi:MAG: Fic family protein [Clostridia bacterium]|nr:Fic family protein [Clostridia bacterium]
MVIKKLHKLFCRLIDEKEAGKYRKRKVFISGSAYSVPNPEKIPGLMKEFVAKMNKIRQDYHPVEFAGVVHKELVFIHPFVDGNGRVARLLMNLILLQDGYLSIVLQ